MASRYVLSSPLRSQGADGALASAARTNNERPPGMLFRIAIVIISRSRSQGGPTIGEAEPFHFNHLNRRWAPESSPQQRHVM